MVSGQSYVPQMCDLWSCGVKLGCNDVDEENKTGSMVGTAKKAERERERDLAAGRPPVD